MSGGKGANKAPTGVFRLIVCGLLVFSVTACYSRPFFDQRVRAPGDPAVAAPAVPEASEPSPPTEAAAPRPPIGGVYRGTDSFTRRVGPAAGGAPVLRTPAGEVTLNFVDADLREVVKAILGDTLGANYVMDPQVQGVVTLQTAQPVPGPALVSVLESILTVNNAALVENQGVYRIVPIDQAVRGGGGLRSILQPPTQAPGAQVLVVPLRHVSAGEVEKLLAPFAPAGGILRVDPRRNIVVLGGTRSDLAAMVDIIDTFDVDWLAGMSFGLFPVQSTSAKTMVEELDKVFGDLQEGPLAGVVRFVPIERINSVLVISPRSLYVDRAKLWIDRLDVGEDETPRLYVYYCENSRAEDLAAVLTQVFAKEGEGAQARPQAQLAPGLQPVNVEGQAPGGGADAGGPSLGTARAGAPTPLTAPPTPGPAGGGSGGPRPGGDQGVALAGGGGSVKIIADKVKNALVVLAKPSDWRTVEAALRRLDIVPLQVLIEATILEVRLNDALNYGVEWFFKFGGSSRVAFSRLDVTAPSPVEGVVTSAFPGFSYLLSPTQDSVRVIVNALDSVSDVNVISSPQVFVLDNQTATLLVGDQVPIQTRTAQSVISPDAPQVNSIEYRDTGVILNVTPRVNAGGLVTMEISQEVSDVVATTTSELDSPTIRQRKVESTVAVQNGETVALGGLIRDSRADTSSGLPYISRIPFIGWLFGTKSDSADRTELLVLITPRVVASMEEARRATEELRTRLRTLAPLEQRLQ